jgi:hypothetical protein
VAPGPASGEDTSLQVGPKLDCRLVRCFCALAGVITASPPLVTPTATPVPATDWAMTSALNGFVGPCAGWLDTAALVLKIFLSSAAAPRRRGTGASGDSASLHTGTIAQGG